MQKASNEKLKNLILYVLSHEDYKEGGIKKLNKLLYFIDFYYFRDNEQLISDSDYAKADMGPVLDKYRIIFDELENTGVLKAERDTYVKYRPKEEADLSNFSAREIDHIGKILHRYGHLSGQDLEHISHQQQPWVLTEGIGDIIDPDLALLMADDQGDEAIVLKSQSLKQELIQLADSAA